MILTTYCLSPSPRSANGCSSMSCRGKARLGSATEVRYVVKVVNLAMKPVMEALLIIGEMRMR